MLSADALLGFNPTYEPMCLKMVNVLNIQLFGFTERLT